MVSQRGLACVLVLAACGGGEKKVKQPKPEKEVVVKPKVDTEADREAKRKAARLEIVPAGSNCLPTKLKEPGAPQLELAGVGTDAVLCAVDTDASRALGQIACWKVDLKNMGNGSVPLLAQDTAPQPGHDVIALVRDGCAMGFCTPGKNAAAPTAHLSWSADGKQVAMLVGTDVHIFDAASKQHVSTFGVTGDKGVTGTPTAVHFVADSIIVEGGDDAPGAWVFKADGNPTGPIMALGGKDEKQINIKHGSFSVLDPNKVALADHGMDTFTVYEIGSGKRTKAVHKPAKLACKPAEVEAYWADGDKVTDKCKDSIAKATGPWVGATAVLGAHSLLFVMKGDRFGELAIVDPKTLVESKKALKLPWCGGGETAGGGEAAEPKAAKAVKAAKPAKATKDDDDAEDDKAAAPKSSRSPVKKGGDPEDGGE
ncbi:MAG TPA: hypothetical protein VFQ65_22550 [Kofleriaceae bacterium]|nr:hypothetical protein [Kofleriaceae bacterium]